MSEPICIVGDSITGGVVYLEDSARYVRCKDSFVNLLGGALSTEMRNHSKFGLTSEAALRKLGRFEGDIAQCPHTLVMLGGNDSDFDWAAVADTPDAPHDCNTPVSRFRECYNAVLDRIIALGSRPVVISLIPVWGRRYYEWFSRKLDGAALMRFLGTTDSIEHWNEMYNLEVIKAAARRDIPFIDVRSAFLSARDFTGLFSRDGIHPSPAGHRRMFEYSLPQLRAAIG